MPAQSRSQISIDCLLSQGRKELTGDGCVYELSPSEQQISNPGILQAGDYVKVRLWLPDDDSHISVDLAEIRWIQDHWISAELLVVSPADQTRLKQFIAVQGHPLRYQNPVGEHILIRA